MIDRDRIERIAGSLAFDSGDRERFSEAVLSGTCGRKVTINIQQPPKDPKLPTWCPDWVTDCEKGEEKGAYTLDLSSVFEGSVLQGIADKVETVIDTCAAPGGKAIFSWRLLKPSTLSVNEVDFSRAKRLRSNIERFGIDNVEYLKSDLRKINGEFQLVLVDAPCSGQSLIARGVEVQGAFNRTVIDRCSDRQKGLFVQASRLVEAGGYLAYMTCTYSRDENEKVIEWFLRRNKNFSTVAVDMLRSFKTKISEIDCYRLFPFDGFGAGGFTALLRKE